MTKLFINTFPEKSNNMKFFIAICLFFSIPLGAGEAPPKKKTVCLNMIVKNESLVIEKCLNSVKPLIDYWVIVDTGSTDNTQEIVKKCMKGIPGKLYEKPWKDFAHNRNEAFALAKKKADYILLIDADEFFQYSDDFSLPALDHDFYAISTRTLGASDAKRLGLVKTSLNWKWEGAIHEFLNCDIPIKGEVMKGIMNVCNSHPDRFSGRSKDSYKTKYLRDAELLIQLLKDDPENSRYTFYLGVSFAVAEKFELAKKSYAKRILMPSKDTQETFLAIYYLGCMEEKLGEFDAALKSFSKAYAFRPIRPEPLFRSAIVHRLKGDLFRAYQCIKHALALPCPENEGLVSYLIYDHEMMMELVNCAVLLGKYQEAFEATGKLLENPNLPDEHRSVLQDNYKTLQKKLNL